MSHVREFSFHFCNNISAINGNLDATTIAAFWVPGCPFKPLPEQRDNREEVMFHTLSMWVKVSQLTCCSKLFRTEQNTTEHNTTHNTTQHSFTGVTMPKITVLCLLELPSSKSKAPSGEPLLTRGTHLFSLAQVCTRCRCRKQLSQERKWGE